MTTEQNNQVISWLIYAIALATALIFNPYIGIFLVFLTIPLRDRDRELEYAREFAEKYKLLVYLPFVIIAGFAVFFVYRSIVNRTRMTLPEIFLPLTVLLPVLIYFEYKLFKRNA